ncbi:MAG: outer membrane beta-barrel protein [Gammaproteobacteria bacterium]|nr:outer membrane beta-barrel protein [Gammaproteobacteria bacterium]
MRKWQKNIYLTLGFALLPCSPILALDFSKFYFGANAGYSKSESLLFHLGEHDFTSYVTNYKNSGDKNTSTTYRISGGYQFNNFFSFDASYWGGEMYTREYINEEEDFDNPSTILTSRLADTISVSSIDLSSLVSYSFSSRYAVYGRLGAMLRQASEVATINYQGNPTKDIKFEDSNWAYHLGLGTSYLFGKKRNYELRLELEHFSKTNIKQTIINQTNSISAGLVYYFGNKNPSMNNSAEPLPYLSLSETSGEEGKPLEFSILLSKPASVDIPISLKVTNVDETQAQTIISDEISISTNNGSDWKNYNRKQPINFILKQGGTKALARLNTIDNHIQNPNLALNFEISSDSVFVTKQQVKTQITIIDNDKKIKLAASNTQASLNKGDTIRTSLSVSDALVSVHANKDTANKRKQKQVLPIVRPIETKHASTREHAISNLMWNDIRMYEVFDSKDRMLLPAIDFVESLVQANQTRFSTNNMYDDAEQAARDAGANFAMWGNTMEFDGQLYIESHLSLVDKPVIFNATFRALDNLSLELSIPRTRFAFALKEISDNDINNRKLLTTEKASIYANQNTSGKRIKHIKAGTMLLSDKTEKQWFKLKTADQSLAWIHASQVALVPSKVYLDSNTINLFESIAATKFKSIIVTDTIAEVLQVEEHKNKTWIQIQSGTHKGWIDAQQAKPKPVLPMTEFLIGLQHFQKQNFNAAIVALQRFISSNHFDDENNVSLSTAYQMLGFCYMQKSQWPLAQHSIDKALLLTKYDPAIYTLKAVSILAQQFAQQQKVNLDSVIKQLAFALYLEPDDVLAKKLVVALNKAHNKPGNTNTVRTATQDADKHFEKLLDYYNYAGID